MNELQTNAEPVNLLKQAKEIEDILRQAGRQAHLIHKKLGNPVATWGDGKVVILPPEEIPVDDDPDQPKPGEG